MDFTEIYPQSSSLVVYSPGNQFLLTARENKLVVRRAQTLQITHVWQLATGTNDVAATNGPQITQLGWSCDSEYVLAVCANENFVSIHRLRDESWCARIEAGVEGLTKAFWAPDGRTILCFSDWSLRVTMWSLVLGKAISYIQYPSDCERGWAFRPDGRYLILAERQKSKDAIGIYDTQQSYKPVRHFPLPTSSMAALALSPRGTHLAVWENVMEYKLFIFTLTGRQVASFTPDADPGLGIRHVAWHPGGTFLAVGGWDNKVHILDNRSWAATCTIDLNTRISQEVKIWREPKEWLNARETLGFFPYDRVSLSVLPHEPSKSPQRSGANFLEWNLDGTLFSVKFDTSPTALLIVRIPGPTQAFRPRLQTVLLHHEPILHARWNPTRSGSLVCSCSSGGVYLWSDEWASEDSDSEDVAECVSIPSAEFRARDILWSPDGKGMILLDKDTFCCAIEVEGPQTDEPA